MSRAPLRMTVPYRVGRSWLAQEYASGRTPEPVQAFLLDPDALSEELAQRCQALLGVLYGDDFTWRRIYVHGTGIDGSEFQESNQPPEPKYSRMDDPIVALIGDCPEVEQPTEDAELVIDAYERWVEDYRELAPKALAAWADRFASSLDEFGHVEDEMAARGLRRDQFELALTYRVEGEPDLQHTVVSARKDLGAFQKARSAWICREVALPYVRRETVSAANYVLGEYPTLPAKTFNISDLVEAYETWAQEWASVAHDHHWALQRAQLSFDEEMKQWAEAMGSDRLKMGLADGFRMTRVYLEERIAHEAPGFYALFQEEGKGSIWNARNGPTEDALRMRRWVQDRLDSHGGFVRHPPKATIGWIKTEDLPSEMIDWSELDERYCDPIESFEAIVVPNWLGRYTLIGPIGSPRHPVPEPVTHVLREVDYDPNPTSDFRPEPGRFTSPAPAPPGGGSAADEDIPF